MQYLVFILNKLWAFSPLIYLGSHEVMTATLINKTKSNGMNSVLATALNSGGRYEINHFL